MNKAVYTHWLRTYGRSPVLWLTFGLEILRALLSRIVSPIILALSTSRLATGDIDGAIEEIWYLFIVLISVAVLGPIGQLTGVHAENKAYRKLRLFYYHKLTGKDMRFYRDNQTGYLSSMFRQYLDGMIQLSRFLRGDTIRSGISLVAPVIVLFVADWRIGLIILGVVALQIGYIFWASAKANTYRALAHQAYRETTGEVTDEITNITAFKSSGKEEQGYNKVAQLGDKETRAFWLRYKTTSLLDLPRGLLTAVAMAAAFFVMLQNATTDPAASVGLMVLLIIYMMQLSQVFSNLPNLIAQHDDLITKIHPALDYLGRDYESIADSSAPQPLSISRGAISFRDISFSYTPEKATTRRVSVFKNLSIDIAGGEHVGVVGLSGAGKSTLASLLMRFDDVGEGTIKIDDTDIRDVAQSDLRRNIAYVPQEPLLFHRSIRQNIAYFEDTADEKAIIRAAKAAHAHEFISELPDGYDTIVGERGVKLSGGQKQRVVIARAILMNAPVMLFDEATSALDSESEHIIQQAMPDIIGRHTAIVIAHRLSTVSRLDRIIVMHRGKIAEEGTHRQLLRKRGRYYALWQRQASQREHETSEK